MAEDNLINGQFLNKLDKVIEANLTNEQFRVTVLAKEMGMSRYTLHRKISAATKLSVSQYIRQVRLKNAMKLLRQKSLSVSEVAYKVGFNSPIYFSKCFHEYYGYPPNSVGKRDESNETDFIVSSKKKRYSTIIIASLVLILITVILFFIIVTPYSPKNRDNEKSVVFLYPVYNSGDSTYFHQINGTIDAVLNNLSMVNELTVFPMSTTLKYRNSEKSGVDIAKELRAGYVVESSGFSYKDKIRLNIKLISVPDGIQIWYNPYDININDIINLPLEISQKIADEIKAKITPEERKRMDVKPTSNSTAWSYYLKGIDLLNDGLSMYYGTGDAGNTGNSVLKGIRSFEEAIKNFTAAYNLDENFALAYAQTAITYSLMDIGKNDGKYSDEINRNADLAILNDSQNDLCLLAKSYDYFNQNQFKKAIPFLEKAILINQKSVVAYRLLANIYGLTREANTEKYLEYKLQVVKWNNFVDDNIQKSEDYRLAARALRVAGLNDEALKYIEKSIEFNPENYSALGEKCEILIEKENDYFKAREILANALVEDSSNIEILRFLFTNYYLTGEYQNAYKYFVLFFGENKNLSYLASKDYSRLTVLYKKLNMKEESEICLQQYKAMDRSKLNEYSRANELARLYSLENNKEKALEALKILNRQPYHFSYTIRMLKDDPVFETIQGDKEFEKIISEMDTKFKFNSHQIRSSLSKKGLL